MQRKPTLSINKVVIFIVFICAAIMTSLFVFHSRHKSELINLSAGNGMMFPVSREIKSFDLVTANHQKFSQKDFLNHWTLLFFGFTHCRTVCPTTLNMLSKSFAELHDAYPNLQVVLVSLDPERDTPDTVAKYSQSFEPSFIGVTGKIQEIRKLQSQLGIASVRDPAQPDGNYQLQHTSSILLIDPSGKWAGVFKFGMDPNEFAGAFKESMRALG